jgi:DNA-binding beta-propeller fold protein YncE
MAGQVNQGIALSANDSLLYVASEVANVFVFNAATGTQLSTITTGCRGFDLRRHPTFSQLYVSCVLDGKVVAVNPSTNVILTTYAVGGKPREMSFDPGTAKIIVPNENGWVDLLTPPVQLSSRPFGSAVSASGVGWISQLDAYNIKRIDMATGAFTGDVFLGSLQLPVQIAANQAGTRIYTAAFDETSSNQGLVASISTSTLSIVSSIRLTGDAQGIAATPAGDTVIVGMTDGPIHRVSLGGSPNVVVSKTGLPSALAYHFAWSPDRSKLYASSYGGNAVYELNPQTLATIRTFSVPGKSPQAIAVSSDGATLYIASEVADILVWNLASGLQGTTITTGCRGGGLVLVSSTRLFDSCTLDGKVVIVNPTTGLTVQTQITNGRPRELSYDAGTGRVLVPNETGGFVDRLTVP